jgi:RNA polymerase sigma-70 factor (ECF subfamily)
MDADVRGDPAAVDAGGAGVLALEEDTVTRDASEGIPGPGGASLPAGSPQPVPGWAKLVDENIGWLRGWVRGRVRDPDLVHDICQESFLKALRSLGELKDASRFGSWLYRIAENTLRDHLRRKARQARRMTFSDDMDSLEARPEAPGRIGEADKAETAEEADRLLGLVRSLPPRYREPLLLRHSRDLSYAEIGRILGIRENAVQVRIFRARKMLRETLGREERLRETLAGRDSRDAGDRGGST